MLSGQVGDLLGGRLMGCIRFSQGVGGGLVCVAGLGQDVIETLKFTLELVRFGVELLVLSVQVRNRELTRPTPGFA